MALSHYIDNALLTTRSGVFEPKTEIAYDSDGISLGFKPASGEKLSSTESLISSRMTALSQIALQEALTGPVEVLRIDAATKGDRHIMLSIIEEVFRWMAISDAEKLNLFQSTMALPNGEDLERQTTVKHQLASYTQQTQNLMTSMPDFAATLERNQSSDLVYCLQHILEVSDLEAWSTAVCIDNVGALRMEEQQAINQLLFMRGVNISPSRRTLRIKVNNGWQKRKTRKTPGGQVTETSHDYATYSV